MSDFEIVPLPPSFTIREIETAPAISAEVLRQVRASWQAEQTARGGTLADEKLFALVGDDARSQLERNGTLTGAFTDYRFFLAQHNRSVPYESLKVRPLAVTGIVRAGQCVLLGRRASTVTQDPSLWELAPAGGLTVHSRVADNRIDPVVQVLDELLEEVNIPRSAVQTTSLRALLADKIAHVHDVVIDIALGITAAEALHRFEARTNTEYSAAQFVEKSGLRRFALENPVSEAARVLIQALASEFEGVK